MYKLLALKNKLFKITLNARLNIFAEYWETLMPHYLAWIFLCMFLFNGQVFSYMGKNGYAKPVNK
jgi:hypothetical protein